MEKISSIVLIGGDGILSEIINAYHNYIKNQLKGYIYSSDEITYPLRYYNALSIPVSLIKCGTSNNICLSNCMCNPELCAYAVCKGSIRFQDAMRLKFKDNDKYTETIAISSILFG